MNKGIELRGINAGKGSMNRESLAFFAERSGRQTLDRTRSPHRDIRTGDSGEDEQIGYGDCRHGGSFQRWQHLDNLSAE
jgi:hypothetical protein